MQTLTTARVRVRPSFVMRNGRYVRDHRASEVVIHSGAKGDSLSKFPRSIAQIGYHKWS